MSGANGHTHAGVDLGADRENRSHLCTKQTWCVLPEGHAYRCFEFPRTQHQPTDFGPKR